MEKMTFYETIKIRKLFFYYHFLWGYIISCVIGMSCLLSDKVDKLIVILCACPPLLSRRRGRRVLVPLWLPEQLLIFNFEINIPA